MTLELFTTVVGFAMSLGHPITAYTIYKTKRVDGVSLPAMYVFLVGTSTFTLYGWYLRNYVIIASFVLGVLGSAAIILLTYRYKKN